MAARIRWMLKAIDAASPATTFFGAPEEKFSRPVPRLEARVASR
jgi:hypothetical protein